jgi:hypothetical protein
MEKRIKFEACVRVNIPGRKPSEMKVGMVTLMRNANVLFMCLKTANPSNTSSDKLIYNILAIYPGFNKATIPMSPHPDSYYKLYGSSLIMKIAEVENKFSEDPPVSSWKRIIIQHLGDGELRVITSIGNGILLYSINPETNEITIDSEHVIEVITEKNVRTFMRKYFGLWELYWLLPPKEQEKVLEKVGRKQKKV